MLTIQPFVGQPTNNNIATSNNHSATWKIPNTNFFPSSIMQLWKVRQILKVCGSFTKKYENPASHQKPPATCETYSPQQMSQFNKTGSPHPVPFQSFLDPWQIPTLLRGFKTKCPTGRVTRLLQGQPKRPIRQGGCHYYVFQKRIEASKTAGHKVTSKASCCRPIWLYFFI